MSYGRAEKSASRDDDACGDSLIDLKVGFLEGRLDFEKVGKEREEKREDPDREG